jgi:hypothetical protein
MKTAPRIRTIRGAQIHLGKLNAQIDRQAEVIVRLCEKVAQLECDCVDLAKVAAEGPCFNNPLDAWAAKTLRDRILRVKCGLLPDGSRIDKPISENPQLEVRDGQG